MLGVSWLFVLGGFVVNHGWPAGWRTPRLPAAQYAALVGFVVAEALIFVPLLYVAEQKGSRRD